MILAIDIGNSNVVIGCLDGENNVKSLFRMVTDLKKTEYEYASSMKNLLEFNKVDLNAIEGVVISSVVPPLTEIFRMASEKLTNKTALVLGAGVKTGLNIHIENPASLGADIVAVSVAAMTEYSLPVIVIDMGTATTITVVDRLGRFIGGAIVPGVALSVSALSSGTSLLHKVPLEAPQRCINSTTTACMQSGAVYGNAALLDGMVERFEGELGEKCTVVATGGIAAKILPHCQKEMIYDENLLLKGLGIIYQKNKRN